MPRERLYTLYQVFCTSRGLESTTVSGFGRMVYRVFPELQSRRIGTRPNTKMNYSGVRLATSDDAGPVPAPSPPPQPSRILAPLQLLQPFYTLRPSLPSPCSLLSLVAPLASPPRITLGPSTTARQQQQPLGNFNARIGLAGYVDPRAHPWAALPILASLELVENCTGAEFAHIVQLAQAIRSFLVTHDVSSLDEAANQVLQQFNRDPYDHTVYDCLFVVAWWQRFLLGEPRGRKQAAATLERMLCGPLASGTISFSPAIELLRSCTHEPLAFALEEGELERVIEQCTTEKKQRPQKDRSITVVVKESVATVLLAALRSLTTVNCGDRSQVALLAQTLNQIREPNFLALCLHELDNRDLLETTLHVLPFAFPDSHGLHLLFNRLLDVRRPQDLNL